MIELVAVVGPTAAGKSELAMSLAERLGGEIVNADSMQLYRGMDIGTAKPDRAERERVAHHVFDVWPVTQEASVVDYQRRALAAAAAIRARGRCPVLVGGSGLYVRAVVDRIDFPGTDPQLRSRFEAELTASGPAALHSRLSEVDPAAAAAILPSNGRRLVRALEVIELTGRPFSASLPSYAPQPGLLHLGVEHDRLDERIEARVQAMWDRGLVAETEALLPLGLRTGRTASRALGYAQVLSYVDGSCTEAEARADTVGATRRFARRQRSWFRRDPRVVWLPGTHRLDAALRLIDGVTLSR